MQASRGTYAEMLDWARRAESLGLAAFAMPDHYISGRDETPGPALDALAVMAGLARDTESVELVLLVSPVTWRHPAVLAKTVATLNDMSGDRVVLGVGTGWWEREHTLFGIPFPDRSVRFEMLEEALAYLRAAFADPPVDFSGSHYSFRGFDMQPRPPLRLLVGGTGASRTPRLAGEFADEFNAYPAAWPDFEAKIARARRAAITAGRDPDELRISTSGVLAVGEDDAGFRASLEGVAEVLGRDPDQLVEGLRARNAPHGTWEQVFATLSGLAERGVDRFYLQAFTDDIDTAFDKLQRLVAGI